MQKLKMKVKNNVLIKCKSKESEITIPDEITGIESRAFAACKNLKKINLGKNISSLNLAFFDCALLNDIVVDNENKIFSSSDGILFNKDKTELLCYPNGKNNTSYTVPEYVEKLGGWAFSGNAFLESVTLHSKMSSVGRSAFSECKKLQKFVLPNSISSVESNTFSRCINLKNITIPQSVTKIDTFAFSYCRNLKAILYEGTKGQWAIIDKGGWLFFNAANYFTVYCSDGEINLTTV